MGRPGFVYCCWRTLDHSFHTVLAGLGWVGHLYLEKLMVVRDGVWLLQYRLLGSR